MNEDGICADTSRACDGSTGAGPGAAPPSGVAPGLSARLSGIPDEVKQNVDSSPSQADAAGAPVYRGYRPRPLMPDLKLFHGYMAVIPTIDRDDFAALEASFDEPFVGITTDGTPRSDLYSPEEPAAATDAIVDAALDFIGSLSFADQRAALLEPLESANRRRWTNAFTTWIPSGVLLDDLDQRQRDAAMAVLAATLSPRGLAEARTVMALNRALGDFVALHHDTLREWTYWFTIYGEPSVDEPWGWQLMGHHLVLNCLIANGHVELAPVFMGAEMVEIDEGPLAGASALQDEQRAGLALVRSLSAEQQGVAVLHRTMITSELPPEMQGRVEGRHRAGAGRDNLVLPYAGIRASELDAAQQQLLLDLIDVFVGRKAKPHAALELDRIRRHLGETHFAWIGDPDSDGPFYYRVHSPVTLLEFDHHAGIFLTSEEPQPFHIHTIVRAPNGGDYGIELLRRLDARLTPRR
jgi:hypothetical protein